MDVQKYLDRIGFEGAVEVSLSCLARLQLSHQTHIPFENLDNFTGRRKVLQEEALYHQVSEDMSPSYALASLQVQSGCVVWSMVAPKSAFWKTMSHLHLGE